MRCDVCAGDASLNGLAFRCQISDADEIGAIVMPVIRDVMNKQVVTLRPDDALIAAVELLCKHQVSGAPVMAENGEIIGFVSEPDLMDVLFDKPSRSMPVSAYMNDGVYAVSPDDSLASAASMFTLYNIRRLPVVENGTLVGIVTRRDLLQYAHKGEDTLNDPLVELIPAIGEYA
jgi:CBS domain-containing protein